MTSASFFTNADHLALGLFSSSHADLMKHTDNMHKHHDTHLNKPSPQHVVFRFGKLRFGLHGLLGILATTFTVTAYYQYPTNRNLAVLAVSQLLNSAIAYHANTLLPQVPPFTQIVPGIVAPHKEAFKRTISVFYYLIARVTLVVCAVPVMGILLGTGIGGSDNNNAQSVLQRDEYSRYLCCAVLAYFWWPLVPSWTSQLWNGNTWIFVFPIFVGITGDFYQYIAYRDVIPVEQLLQTQILGLVLAFSFTLAFRNYVSMPTVYVGAALGVFKTLKEAFATIQAGTAAAAVV
jgi:hypothetical protein